MSINLDVLTQNLLEAEDAKTFTPPQVNDYVLRHIYEPLLRDETVCFAELNFKAFCNEDLRALANFLEACGAVEQRLATFSQKLCNAPPVSRLVRAFC